MTEDLLVDLIGYIVTNKLATQKDVDIFSDYLPDEPDSCISLLEYAGSGAPWYADMSVRSVQVNVRAKTVAEAKERVWKIYHLFHQPEPIIKIEDRTCIISLRSTPIKIATDSHSRVRYAFNMGITTKLNV